MRARRFLRPRQGTASHCRFFWEQRNGSLSLPATEHLLDSVSATDSCEFRRAQSGLPVRAFANGPGCRALTSTKRDGQPPSAAPAKPPESEQQLLTVVAGALGLKRRVAGLQDSRPKSFYLPSPPDGL